MSRGWVALALLFLVCCTTGTDPLPLLLEAVKHNASQFRLPTGPKLLQISEEERTERARMLHISEQERAERARLLQISEHERAERARVMAWYLQPVIEMFILVVLDDLIPFAIKVCHKFHLVSHAEVSVHEFPGLVEDFCGFLPDEHEEGYTLLPEWMMETTLYGLTVVDRVAKRTECIEKALCLFDPARTWLSFWPVRIALSFGEKTGFLDKMVPLPRLQIAIRALAWEVKGEICCSFFLCDITIFFRDGV